MSVLSHVRNPGPRKGVGNYVFIAIPTGSGSIAAPCIASVVGALPILEREGIGWDLFLMAGNCHVDDARNGCVREFLKTDCTDLFFIDADVGFDPEALAKLLKLDRDLVAGVYPKKQDREEFPVRVRSGVELWAETDGVVEVLGAPTGFMRIRRNVLEKMTKVFSDRQFKGQSDGPDDPPYTEIFARTLTNGERMSGDYAFCQKWRDMGGKVYVDPEIPFSHEGPKEWVGVLGDYWRRTYGVTEARYVDAIKRLREGDVAPELFIRLYQGWGNNWAATPELLQAAFHAALRAGGPILECGSGLSTLVLAIAGERAGNPVVSLESDPQWYGRVFAELQRVGLKADVRFSPIVQHEGFKWYAKPEIEPVGMVLCDGPAREFGREGLFKLLASEIKGAAIVMDDVDDPRCAELLNGWAAMNGHVVKPMGKFAVCNHKPLLRAA